MTKFHYSKYAYTTGSNWKNLPASNLVDGKSASNSYKKGGNPAPVYFDLGYDIGDGNKVTRASFCISIPQKDGLSAPTVKFYNGNKYGRNVYKHSSYIFKTMTSPTKHGNSPKFPTEENREKGGFEGSTIWYKYYYNVTGITRQQLKNLIVGVDFGKSSSAGKARIGWARMEFDYEKDTSYTLDIYSNDMGADDIVYIPVNSTYRHFIYLHNNSSSQKTAYYKTVPDGGLTAKKISQTGVLQTSGTYKNWNKRYVPANNKTDDSINKKGTHLCTWDFTPTTEGLHKITDILKNKDDKGHSKQYDWYIYAQPVNAPPENYDEPEVIPIEMMNEHITISPPLMNVNKGNQFVKVNISGYYNGTIDDNNAMNEPDENNFLHYRWNANADCTDDVGGLLTMVNGSYIPNSTFTDDESGGYWQGNNCRVRFIPEIQEIEIEVYNPDDYNYSAEMYIAVNPTDYNTYSDVPITDLKGYYYEKQFYKHSVYDELIVGYYYDNNFYSDSGHNTLIEPQNERYYYDRHTGNGYYYQNGVYKSVILANSIIYYDLEAPTNGVYLDALNRKRFRYYKDMPIKVCREGGASAIAYTDIFGEQTTLYSINDNIETKFKTYCNTVLSTTIMGVNTIKCKSSRSCFFEEMDTDYSISIEQPQAFIGVVPITRPHQADNKASTKNGLIKKSYLNRRYMGKTGEIDEEIGMELFLTPGQVATLQGLVALDEPVPINLVPHMKDGDPLNHRGWAELSEVDNIEKINSFTYKCEPKVDYLTHDLNTTFQIIKGDNVNNIQPPYYLTLSHDFTDKLSDIMNIDSSDYTDMSDDYGYIGNYTLNPRNQIIFTTNRPIAKFSDIDIKWRNVLEVFKSRDLNDCFNVRIQLIKDVEGEDEPEVYFEYLYDDFQHYNATNGYTMNMFKHVQAKVLENGILKTQDGGNLSLLNNDLTSLTNLNKEYTKMWLNSNSLVTEDDDYIDIILSTKSGELIMGELVTITLQNDFGYFDKKVYMSDMYGRLRIPTNLEDGEYAIICEMPETKIYRPNTFKTVVEVAKELEDVIINYMNDYSSVYNGDNVEILVTDGSGNPLANKNIIVDIRNVNSSHYGACINYITNSDGYIYPTIKTDGGSKLLRARFISDGVYANDTLTQSIYVNDDYKRSVAIETDKYEVEIDEVNKEYVVRLGIPDEVNNTIKPLSGETIEFIIYNNEEYIERSAVTNDSGFASIPVNITNGAWYIDSYYAGKTTIDEFGQKTVIYNPVLVTNIIKNYTNEKKETMFAYENNNVISNPNDGLFNVILTDEDYVPLKDKPVEFIASINNNILFDGIVITDENGIAELPLYDNSANVNVTVKYNGDNKYEKCEYNTNISFKYAETNDYDVTSIKLVDNIPKLYKSVTNVPIGGVPVIVTINKCDENGNLYYNSHFNYTINEIGTIMTGNDGTINIPNLPNGRYLINISYKGDDTNTKFKPCNISFYNNYNDTTNNIPNIDLVSVIDKNGASFEPTIVNNNYKLDDIQFSRKIFKIKFKVTDSLKTIKDENDNDIPAPISNAYVKCTSSCVSGGYTNENGEIELEVLNSNNNGTFDITVDVDVGILYNTKSETFTFNTFINNNINNNISTNVEYIDDDYSELSWQELLFNTTTPNDDIQVNEYYKVKLVNTNLNNVIEFNYMGVNKFNNNIVNFYVDKGTWDMYVYGFNIDSYCDTYVHKSLNITNTSDNTTPQELIEILESETSNSIVDDFENEKMFGSQVRLQLRDNKITVYDFGYTDSDNSNNVKLKVDPLDLYYGEYYLRIIFQYYDIDNPFASYNIDKNPIEGYLQVKMVEDMETSDLAQTYSNTIVSPVPLADDKCLYTRMTEDGRLYFYNYDKVQNKIYIGSPYNQYKGGTNLVNELGADLFDLDSGSNPLYITNGICKMSIHRLSGYIELFVRDEEGQWLLVNVLRVRSDYTASLQYGHDKMSITYSGITFTMWRGRPYIEIKHNGRDIEVLDYKDRVYCEVDNNGLNMRLIEESDVGRGTFDINTSTQKFDKALQVGQNIGLDNFDLYDVSD